MWDMTRMVWPMPKLWKLDCYHSQWYLYAGRVIWVPWTCCAVDSCGNATQPFVRKIARVWMSRWVVRKYTHPEYVNAATKARYLHLSTAVEADRLHNWHTKASALVFTADIISNSATACPAFIAVSQDDTSITISFLGVYSTLWLIHAME